MRGYEKHVAKPAFTHVSLHSRRPGVPSGARAARPKSDIFHREACPAERLEEIRTRPP